MVRILLMALAGLSVGGAIAILRQKRSRWLSLAFLVVGALLVWAAYSVGDG